MAAEVVGLRERSNEEYCVSLLSLFCRHIWIMGGFASKYNATKGERIIISSLD